MKKNIDIAHSNKNSNYVQWEMNVILLHLCMWNPFPRDHTASTDLFCFDGFHDNTMSVLFLFKISIKIIVSIAKKGNRNKDLQRVTSFKWAHRTDWRHGHVLGSASWTQVWSQGRNVGYYSKGSLSSVTSWLCRLGPYVPRFPYL